MPVNAVECVPSELVDDSVQFFAPVDADVIDSLLGRYQSERAKIERISQIVNSDEYRGAVAYFLSGNSDSSRHYSLPSVENMFALKGAIFSLNSRYWGEALSLTDVYDCMPQARRDAWNAQLQGKDYSENGSQYDRVKLPPLPDFEEATVRNTLGDLLRQRATFFAERVDGIFRGLSGDHVTNHPQGFGARMIVGYMLSYGSISHSKAGMINDLRCVIAKFMGRDEPKHNSSDVLVREMYKCTGQWVAVDGGTLRIRVYKKGTAHLEVHPDMAWRLNQVLASLHPLAIPAEFRSKPKKKAKDFLMMGRPLPFATLDLLAAGLHSYGARDRAATVFAFEYSAKEHQSTYKDACAVLAALGGTPNKAGDWEFDYPIADVLNDVIITGCLPDQKSHQFYPTPDKLARIAVELASIGEYDTVLEPSAGQGGIADRLPKDQTTCIEISALHCAVLRSKGLKTVEADFILWSETAQKFDVVVMNPPFSEGRAKLHVEAASTLLKPGGRLVAILPASMRGKDLLGKGFDQTWSGVYDREFAGTGVSVAILKATL